ncbi:hypothetical protein HW555_014092, partial [Spodoptera exigua]
MTLEPSPRFEPDAASRRKKGTLHRRTKDVPASPEAVAVRSSRGRRDYHIYTRDNPSRREVETNRATSRIAVMNTTSEKPLRANTSRPWQLRRSCSLEFKALMLRGSATVRKLDIVTLRDWETQRNNIEDHPSLEEFTNFLKHRADLLVTIEEANHKHPRRHSDITPLRPKSFVVNQTNQTPKFHCPTAPQNVTLSATHTHGYVLLSTAIVNVSDINGKLHKVRVLLDNGSTSSFVTESLLNRLQLPHSSTSVTVQGLNNQLSNITKRCDLSISSLMNNDLILKTSTSLIPHLTFLQRCRCYWVQIFFGKYSKTIKYHLGKHKPTLIETTFGWLVSGSIQPPITSIKRKHSIMPILPGIGLVTKLAEQNSHLKKNYQVPYCKKMEKTPKNEMYDVVLNLM